MGLFVNRPEFGSNIRFSSYGMNKTLLIIGLGNPGEEYDGTRHNVGFACLDAFAKKNEFDLWVKKADFKAIITSKTFDQTRVILCKPQTFMNLSGEAAQAVMHFYKIPLSDVIVIHDELDVDFGQIRMRLGGSSAGHNGVKSVTKHLDEGYGRVRVGIGPKTPNKINSAGFVLQKFTETEQADIPKLIREVSSLLSEYAYGSPVNTETRSFL